MINYILKTTTIVILAIFSISSVYACDASKRFGIEQEKYFYWNEGTSNPSPMWDLEDYFKKNYTGDIKKCRVGYPGIFATCEIDSKTQVLFKTNIVHNCCNDSWDDETPLYIDEIIVNVEHHLKNRVRNKLNETIKKMDEAIGKDKRLETPKYFKGDITFWEDLHNCDRWDITAVTKLAGLDPTSLSGHYGEYERPMHYHNKTFIYDDYPEKDLISQSYAQNGYTGSTKDDDVNDIRERYFDTAFWGTKIIFMSYGTFEDLYVEDSYMMLDHIDYLKVKKEKDKIKREKDLY
jgi:hypothetical protein